MHKTPKKVFEQIALERPPCERYAALQDHVCQGRSTMEHAFIYAGKQIPDKWAVIRLCEWAHLGPGLNKRVNQWLALRHAKASDLARYPKTDWQRLKSHFNAIYENEETC